MADREETGLLTLSPRGQHERAVLASFRGDEPPREPPAFWWASDPAPWKRVSAEIGSAAHVRKSRQAMNATLSLAGQTATAGVQCLPVSPPAQTSGDSTAPRGSDWE
jgi:hypothetical protein